MDMSIRFATDEEIQNWDKFVVGNPDRGNMLQGLVFLSIKEKTGWLPRFIICDNIAIAALEKQVPLLGKMWYIPKGPGVSSSDQLAQIVKQLKIFARQQGIFTIKIEPDLPEGSDITGIDMEPTKAIQYNQHTVVVDLKPSLDEIMQKLPQKGRHAIRRAQRDGVTVERVESTDENCQKMYNLLKETADGAGFFIRSPQYYKDFYQKYTAAGQGQLFFAYFDGRLVSAAFAVILGDKSTYKDGASVRDHPAYGASHLLQWEVINWAKEHGSIEHDLCGTPPAKEIKDPQHPLYGLGRFKTSFNKQVTDYIGAFEIAVKPLKSALWRKYIEKIVRRLYFKKHHESYY